MMIVLKVIAWKEEIMKYFMEIQTVSINENVFDLQVMRQIESYVAFVDANLAMKELNVQNMVVEDLIHEKVQLGVFQ